MMSFTTEWRISGYLDARLLMHAGAKTSHPRAGSARSRNSLQLPNCYFHHTVAHMAMSRVRSWPTFRFAAALVVFALAPLALSQHQARTGPAGDAVLWTDPGDIHSRNLFWGPGGEQNRPQPPAEFLEEDRHGTNPKFDVRDSAGIKWRAKLGPEARPEVVASRLLWAVGYSANENYFLPVFHVKNMPPRLRRGQKFAGHGGNVPSVRLQRRAKGEKKIGNWDWRHNPFVGTREFNGLRVMMALIRNWDLDNQNNAILGDQKTPGRQIYLVTDVGAAFGASGRRYYERNSTGNLDAYRRGRLVAKIKPDSIDLHFPAMPPLSFIFDLPFYLQQLHARWIGKRIPRADAKWIGSLLAQLSPDQIRDAFRAGGYSPDVVEAYTTTLMSRIQELTSL
jgi:hypothetical protein